MSSRWYTGSYSAPGALRGLSKSTAPPSGLTTFFRSAALGCELLKLARADFEAGFMRDRDRGGRTGRGGSAPVDERRARLLGFIQMVSPKERHCLKHGAVVPGFEEGRAADRYYILSQGTLRVSQGGHPVVVQALARPGGGVFLSASTGVAALRLESQDTKRRYADLMDEAEQAQLRAGLVEARFDLTWHQRQHRVEDVCSWAYQVI